MIREMRGKIFPLGRLVTMQRPAQRARTLGGSSALRSRVPVIAAFGGSSGRSSLIFIGRHNGRSACTFLGLPQLDCARRVGVRRASLTDDEAELTIAAIIGNMQASA
jgi:hypothetical protein